MNSYHFLNRRILLMMVVLNYNFLHCLVKHIPNQRDRLMKQYDELFPEYGFAGHKGYGSAQHIAKLKELGPCPIHRRSFIGHFV